VLEAILEVGAGRRLQPVPAQGTSAAQIAASSTPAAGVVSTSPAKKTRKKRPANVTYSNANSGVSFLYPRKALLTSGDDAKSDLAAVGDVPMNFIQPGGASVATVALPDNAYPGTDFSSAFFRVNVNRNVSEQECEHSPSSTRAMPTANRWTPRRPRSARLKWRPLEFLRQRHQASRNAVLPQL